MIFILFFQELYLQENLRRQISPIKHKIRKHLLLKILLKNGNIPHCKELKDHKAQERKSYDSRLIQYIKREKSHHPYKCGKEYQKVYSVVERNNALHLQEILSEE